MLYANIPPHTQNINKRMSLITLTIFRSSSRTALSGTSFEKVSIGGGREFNAQAQSSIDLIHGEWPALTTIASAPLAHMPT